MYSCGLGGLLDWRDVGGFWDSSGGCVIWVESFFWKLELELGEGRVVKKDGPLYNVW